MILRPEFTELIPDILEEGVLYISMLHAVAIHKCACGCGEETITPLDPSRWSLKYDGKYVSLNPSIGNWNFPCRSHYFITRNQVEFCRDWDYEIKKPDKKKRKKKFSWKSLFDL